MKNETSRTHHIRLGCKYKTSDIYGSPVYDKINSVPLNPGNNNNIPVSGDLKLTYRFFILILNRKKTRVHCVTFPKTFDNC